MTAQRVKPQQVLRQLSNSAKPVQGGLGGEFFLPILGTAGVGVNCFVGFPFLLGHKRGFWNGVERVTLKKSS